jgi:hypothetical protein
LQGFWRAYFWNYAVFTLIGLAVELTHPSVAPLRQMIGLVFTPVAALALGGRAFLPEMLAPRTWRTLLFISVAWETFALAIGVSPSSALVASAGMPQPVDTPETHDMVQFVRVMSETVIPTVVWLSALPPLLALYLNAYPGAKPAAA